MKSQLQEKLKGLGINEEGIRDINSEVDQLLNTKYQDLENKNNDLNSKINNLSLETRNSKIDSIVSKLIPNNKLQTILKKLTVFEDNDFNSNETMESKIQKTIQEYPDIFNSNNNINKTSYNHQNAPWTNDSSKNKSTWNKQMPLPTDGYIKNK